MLRQTRIIASGGPQGHRSIYGGMPSTPVRASELPQFRSQTHLHASATELATLEGHTSRPEALSGSKQPSTPVEAKPIIACISAEQQAVALAGLGAAAGFIGTGAWDVLRELDPLRCVVLSYICYSGFEYTFHRYSMHGSPSSLGATISGGRNKDHLDHHAETIADRKASLDMTLLDGYDVDALYFHAPTTLGTFIGSGFLMAGINAAGHIGIPMVSIWATALVSALFYGLAWNTVHADSHYVEIDIPDGLPALKKPYPGSDTALVAWLLENHTIHHTVRGTGNFNIVLPLMDHALGTYYYQNKVVD